VHYPFPGLGAGLFRVREGPPERAFAEFADAQTLMRRNAYFLTRDVRQRGPATCYSTRALSLDDLPRPSLFESAGGPFVVYHPGRRGKPGRNAASERRGTDAPPGAALAACSGNPKFLGVYRWNILRDPA